MHPLLGVVVLAAAGLGWLVHRVIKKTVWELAIPARGLLGQKNGLVRLTAKSDKGSNSLEVRITSVKVEPNGTPLFIGHVTSVANLHLPPNPGDEVLFEGPHIEEVLEAGVA